MTLALRVGRRDNAIEHVTIDAAAGSYAWTGTAAGLARTRKLIAAAGAYALSGTAATLDYSGGAGGFTWDQVTGNEGYRVEWGTVNITTDDQLPYANYATTPTDQNYYDFEPEASTTYYWRVAALVDGFPQIWTAQQSFSS